VTVTGCGVLCPGEGRDCYGCSGPAESPNAVALAARLRALGQSRQDVELRFRAIHSAAAEFADLGTIDD
jgi:hypothetical protein